MADIPGTLEEFGRAQFLFFEIEVFLPMFFQLPQMISRPGGDLTRYACFLVPLGEQQDAERVVSPRTTTGYIAEG